MSKNGLALLGVEIPPDKKTITFGPAASIGIFSLVAVGVYTVGKFAWDVGKIAVARWRS